MKIAKNNIEKNLKKSRFLIEISFEHSRRLTLLKKRLNIASTKAIIVALIDAAYEEYFPNYNQEGNNEQNCK